MRSCPHCGCVLDDGKRSLPQTRRYFAMIKAYHANWPEYASRQFASAERLRKWAQIRAGHYNSNAIDIGGMTKEQALALAEAIIDAIDDGCTETTINGAFLIIQQPKSIRFGSLGHIAACRLFDEVGSVLEAETGIDPETMLKEYERAA